jgi:Ca2+/Na+ antiporter
MALTNAIASNVFDILICLGLPWFIKTAIVDPGSSVTVISRGMTSDVLIPIKF